MAANWGWGLGWSNEQLAVLVQELGSDVAFFLRGRQVHIETRGTDTPGTEMPTTGPAICRGRGERVEPLVPRSVLHCVLVKPPAGLSTADVFRKLRARSRSRGSHSHWSKRCVAVGWLKPQQAAAQPVCRRPRYRLSPWIGRLQREFSRLDCLGHAMSGSGTSYFAVCRHGRAKPVAWRPFYEHGGNWAGVRRVWSCC